MISDSLLLFLTDAELVFSQPQEVDLYHIEPIPFETTDYSFKGWLKFSKSTAKLSECYDEIEAILFENGHFVNHNIVMGVLVLFCVAPRKIRTKELTKSFFSLFVEIKLKQYSFFHATQEEK